MSDPREYGMDLTFRDIEVGLVALMRQREECAEECERQRQAALSVGGNAGVGDGDSPYNLALAELDQCDLALAAYLKAEVQKVDGVAAFILSRLARADMNAKEVERLEALIITHEQAAGRVREIAMRVMQDTEQRTIEGARHTLKLRRNPPAVSDNMQLPLVPAKYRKYVLTITGEDLERLRDIPDEAVAAIMDGARPHPDLVSKSAIAAALKARVTCDNCNGTGQLQIGDEQGDCPRCKGEGTIPGSVAGARLESSERLEIL